MFSKNKKLILVSLFSLTILIGVANFALAQVNPFGGAAQQSLLQSTLGLGAQDPRVTAAKIIRVALGFLGIIAIGLVLYGGFLWLTSGGEASKIERAKKLLISAGIGLVIILSAWGIVTFLLNSLLSATGAPTGSPPPPPGGFCIPACDPVLEHCCTGSCLPLATPCGPPPCIGPGCAPISCNSTPGPTCDPTGPCPTDYYCDGTCWCQPTGGVGDDCDAADTDPSTCISPSDSRCSSYLECDTGLCECQGAPVIQWLSPGDGAVNNFITIGGRYFGTTTGQVYFSNAAGSTTISAAFPNSVNPACTDNWSDTQIIVVVPGGTSPSSSIRVVRADGEQDQTDDSRGPDIADFSVNGIVRPGLCLASPDNGAFSAGFNLQGNNFSGASRDVFFGSAAASTNADNVNFSSNLSATAVIPNVRAGANTVFVRADGENSNTLNFTVNSDSNSDPFIDYLDPAEGPRGQYVTIYGRNFKDYLSGASEVVFENGGATTSADIDFPLACQDKWWRDRYIIVKVPTSLSLAVWRVSVTNKLLRQSNQADFTVTTGTPGPGICALVPHNGPVGQSVETYGDRFGTTAGIARYYNNQPGFVAATDWTNQQITSSVPAGAETGPFTAVDSGGNVSNSLNFTVGKCTPSTVSTTSPECDITEDCCAGGTYDGICRTSGSCGEGTLAACTFAWTFTTTVSTTTPPTCAGYSGAAQCLAAGSCPNSPGQCRTSTSTVSGACGDTDCNASNPVCAGACEYDSGINKCKLTGSSCDQTDDTLVTGYTAECRRVGTIGRWQINTNNASCPLGSFKDANNWCTVGVPGSPAVCDICANGLVCQANECVVNRNVCPVGSSCDQIGGSPTENECIDAAPTCECCCRVANSAEDCCAGLTCEAGGCGNDPVVYGQCTGCSVYISGVFDQAASDAACNCTPGPATRVCNATVNPLGVCEDAGSVGDLCNDGAGGSCSAGPGCGTGLFCDPAAGCTCQSVIGLPCDFSPATPSCQPNNSICTTLDPDTFCDPDSACTCQPTTAILPGARCIDLPSCTDGLASCGSVDYDCLTNASDCRCCCDPTVPQVNAAGLVCQANKTPCDGGSRGLYCGCVNDNECGDPSTTGCSSVDTCCRPRPSVVDSETQPGPGAGDVCRNPLISVTFDQEMDIQSFTGNVIMVGDYGTGACPAGTNYLVGGVYKKYNAFSRLWLTLKKYFGGDARAQVPGNNYCAVSGLVKGHNTSGGEGILNFAPVAVLDPDRDYYVIIKGDDLATASTSEGVLSRYGIGMGDQPPASSADFNGVTYQGYIWQFRTKAIDPGPPADDGICRLEYVTIEPASYLFQKIENDPADDALGAAEVDPPDRDFEFTAYAKSAAGESIVPITAYSWDWNWTSENETVARLGASTSPSVTPAAVLLEAQNKKDAKTYLKVNATITVDDISTPSSVGKAKSAKAPIYVFVCENPWPPVIDPADWPWVDSGSNCTQQAATCMDNNFELYYCRDKAAVGTANDLPAILVEPVVRGTSTIPNQPLKELFFLRENLPGQANLSVSPQPDGTRAVASWPAVASATSYKLYYGKASKNYTEVIETTATTYPVTGLVAGNTYYFAVTAIIGASRVESQPSNEEVVIMIDTWPPPIPTGFTATSSISASRAVDLSWIINSSSDITGYRIYYGAASAGGYASTENVDKNTNKVTISGLNSAVTYIFAVGAVDGAGNVATSTPATATPN